MSRIVFLIFIFFGNTSAAGEPTPPAPCSVSLAGGMGPLMISPNGEITRVDLKAFTLAEFYRPSKDIVFSKKILAEDLWAVAEQQPLPFAVVGNSPLTGETLKNLQQGFKNLWQKAPFIRPPYAPEGAASAFGNGMTGDRFYGSFQIRFSDDLQNGSAQVRWPSRDSHESIRAKNSFEEFRTGPTRLALEVAIENVMNDHLRADPAYFKALYEKSNSRWLDLTVGAIEYWGDLQLLKELAPPTYRQAMLQAKTYGYDILGANPSDAPLNNSGGGIHNDNVLGLQSLMVVDFHESFKGGNTVVYSYDQGKLGKTVARVHGQPGEHVMWATGSSQRGSAHLAGPFTGGYRQILVFHLDRDPELSAKPPATDVGYEKRKLFRVHP